MKDRQSRYPGRYNLITEDSTKRATILVADAPIESGTPLIKNTMLSDRAVSALRMAGDPTVSDAFEYIASNYYTKNEARDMWKIGDIRCVAINSTKDSDWLWCNGSLYNVNLYPELYRYLGTNTLPNIPDENNMRYYIRGKIDGAEPSWFDGELDLTNNVAYIPAPALGAQYTLFFRISSIIESQTVDAIAITNNRNAETGRGAVMVDYRYSSTTGNYFRFYNNKDNSSRTGNIVFNRVIGHYALINNERFVYNDGNNTAAGTASSSTVNPHSGYFFLNSHKSGNADSSLYTTNEALTEAVSGGLITPSIPGTFKIDTLIYYSNAEYSTVEDCLAHREEADIDLRFDANGKPHNAGTSGEIIYSEV